MQFKNNFWKLSKNNVFYSKISQKYKIINLFNNYNNKIKYLCAKFKNAIKIQILNKKNII